MQKIAIITAGGTGTRMGSATPKQFLLLNQKPVLWYTLNAFIEAFNDIEIILVLPQDYVTAGQELLSSMQLEKQSRIVVGGSTRYHSVQNGVQCISNASVVFVHDGVRCLISADLIRRCYEQTIQLGSAIPAVTSTDSIRMNHPNGHKVVNRDHIKIIQTPQTFLSDTLIKAFQQPFQDAFTDEATVVESIGESVYLIEGEYSNIKITRPADLLVAAAILAERNTPAKE